MVRARQPRAGRLLLAGEQGSATAEFAVVLPSVLLVLGIALGGMQLAGQRLLLAAAASDIARALARGDSPAAQQRLAAIAAPHGEPPQVGVTRAEELLCVRLSSRPGRGLLGAIEIAATGCALETRP